MSLKKYGGEALDIIGNSFRTIGNSFYPGEEPVRKKYHLIKANPDKKQAKDINPPVAPAITPSTEDAPAPKTAPPTAQPRVKAPPTARPRVKAPTTATPPPSPGPPRPSVKAPRSAQPPPPATRQPGPPPSVRQPVSAPATTPASSAGQPATTAAGVEPISNNTGGQGPVQFHSDEQPTPGPPRLARKRPRAPDLFPPRQTRKVARTTRSRP
jgi:hypothetical protein